MNLYQIFRNDISVVDYSYGEITVNQAQSSSFDIRNVSSVISDLTSHQWTINIDNTNDGKVYGVNHKLKIEENNKKLLEHDLVKKIIEIFPELEINDIKKK